MSKWLAIVLTAVVGLAGGAYLTNTFLTPNAGNERQVGSVELEFRFDAGNVFPGRLKQGWRKPEDWGTPMQGAKAGLELELEGAAADDVELILDGSVKGPGGTQPANLSVTFNGDYIGNVPLSVSRPNPRRRMIVPVELFNKLPNAEIGLQIVGGKLDLAYGVRTITLKDVPRYTDMAGQLDLCSRSKLAGWAVAGEAAAPVSVMANGKPVEGTMKAVERKDLEAHGYAVDAGFEFTPKTPVPDGVEINVKIYNGKMLPNSPCVR